MGVSDLKSASITNFDASPRVAVDAGKGAGARTVKVEDYITVVASDDATSIYRICRVPTNAKIKSIKVRHPAIGGSAAFDIGVYQANSQRDCAPGATIGAVIDADFFASAYVATNAQLAGIDLTHEATTYLLSERDDPLWSVVGSYTADPGGKFDICATVTVNMDDAGVLLFEVEYVE